MLRNGNLLVNLVLGGIRGSIMLDPLDIVCLDDEPGGEIGRHKRLDSNAVSGV